MRDLVEEVSNPGYSINNVDDLEVAKRDLESMDRISSFNNIDVLEFADDVDWETFKVKVGSIVNVDKVSYPQH